MATKARTTTGTTFTLNDQTYDVEITEVGQEGQSNAVIDATHLASTVVEKIMDELTDNGRLTFATNLEPDKLVALKAAMGVPQLGTLTFKTVGSETAGAKLEGQCAVSEHTFTGPVRDKMSGTFTTEWLGDVTPTAATGT